MFVSSIELDNYMGFPHGTSSAILLNSHLRRLYLIETISYHCLSCIAFCLLVSISIALMQGDREEHYETARPGKIICLCVMLLTSHALL